MYVKQTAPHPSPPMIDWLTKEWSSTRSSNSVQFELSMMARYHHDFCPVFRPFETIYVYQKL